MANLLKIKDIANSKKIPLKTLAEKVDITPQALSRMMRLGSTNTETLERIAEILGVSASIFFESDDNINELNNIHSPMSINGHNINGCYLNDSKIIETALSEIASQRKVTEIAQKHISELTAVVLNLTKQHK